MTCLEMGDRGDRVKVWSSAWALILRDHCPHKRDADPHRGKDYVAIDQPRREARDTAPHHHRPDLAFPAPRNVSPVGASVFQRPLRTNTTAPARKSCSSS